MKDIETQVAEMLNRRAADIAAQPADGSAADQTDDDEADPTGSGRPPVDPTTAALHPDVGSRYDRRRRSAVLAAAAGLAAVVGAIGAGVWSRGSDPLDGDESNEIAATAAEPGPETSSLSASSSSAHVKLAEVVAMLPPTVDVTDDLIWLDADTDDTWQAAAAYLAERLPDAVVTDQATSGDGGALTVLLQTVGVDQGLHLFRWALLAEGFPDRNGPRGWLIGRQVPGVGAGVVVATTEGVHVTDLDRTADGRLLATLTNDLEVADLSLDVTGLDGDPIDGSSRTEAAPAETPPRFGTAGSVPAGGELSIAVPVPVSSGVILRAQHVGGTWLSITEIFVDRATDFAAACGTEPPVSIEVGSLLGPLQRGPAPGAEPPLRGNQQAWHHPATPASMETGIEIRWPPEPDLWDQVDLDDFEPSGVASRRDEPSSPAGGQVTGQVLIGLGGDPNEPCDLLQLSVLGDPDTVEWWTTALSREWSAGLALSVADLDPATNPSSATGEVESTDLVVAAIEDVAPADLPRVAATGSCDGLPDDPPRAGPGPDVGFGTAREALAGFVADEGRAQDPPLPDAGYTEYWSTGGDDARSYVHGFDDTAVVVIDVERIDGSWQVARWEAAPC